MADVTITKDILKKGVMAGAPCIKVVLPDKPYTKEMHDLIVTTIPTLGLRQIYIYGNLLSNPTLKDTIVGLASKNYIVTLVTSGDDTVGPIRIVKNTKFVINTIPPNGTINSIKVENINLLKEDDELCFIISTKQAYEDSKIWLSGKLVTRPVVLFILIQSELKIDEIEAIKAEYLNDCIGFKFKNRIQVI